MRALLPEKDFMMSFMHILYQMWVNNLCCVCVKLGSDGTDVTMWM